MNLSILSKHRNTIYGICALWIVIFHAVDSFGFWPDVSNPALDVLKWFFTKSYGVDVFVFLSGISLYYSFDGNPSYAAFIIKRLRRIVPALLLTYGVKWAILVLAGKYEFPWLLWHLSLAPFFIDGNTDGAWFIAFILVLYLAHPYIHAFIYELVPRQKNSERSFIVKAAVVCAGACLIYWLIHKYAPYYFWKTEIALARVPVFVFGCYLGHRIKSGMAILPPTRLALLFIACLAWLLLLIGPVRDLGVWWYRLYGSLSGVFFAVVFAFLSEIASKVGKGEALRPLRSVGSYSLELYGTHLILYYGVEFIPSIKGSLALLVLYIPLAMFWAWADFKLIEPALINAAGRLWKKVLG